MASNVEINGIRYSGKDVAIDGNGVIIDGKRVELGQELVFNVTVHGNVKTIDGAKRVTVIGTVDKVETMSGRVECGDVLGNVRTMSGNVTAKSIGGGVSTTSGNIIYKDPAPRVPPSEGLGSATKVE